MESQKVDAGKADSAQPREPVQFQGSESSPHSDPLEGSPVLREILGDALPQLEMFHVKLLNEGVRRGLIGPRDPDRLWERHILNSAVIVPFIRQCTANLSRRTVADIGSGGGFPGLVAAACLPDHQFTLVEPMARRVEWLNECVNDMGLTNVVVLRERAESLIPDRSHRRNADRNHMHNQLFSVVTCRAVAPMSKLAGWTLPLLASQGQLIALKGRSAAEEIAKAQQEIRRYGGVNPRVVEAPLGHGLQSTHVVIISHR